MRSGLKVAVLPKNEETSLALMWRAYQRSEVRAAESSLKTSTNVETLCWSSTYGSSTGVENEGAGVVVGLLQARYMNSTQGQFLSQDPTHNALGTQATVKQLTGLDLQKYLSDPQFLNSYAYGRGNPITMKDPSGASSITSFFSYSNSDAMSQAKAQVYQGLQNFANTQVGGRMALGGVALTGGALYSASMVGAMPYVVGAMGNVAVRAYLDSEDGRFNDSAGQYIGSAAFGAVGELRALKAANSLVGSFARGAGVATVENYAVDGKFSLRQTFAGGMGSVGARIGTQFISSLSPQNQARLGQIYQSLSQLSATLGTLMATKPKDKEKK